MPPELLATGRKAANSILQGFRDRYPNLSAKMNEMMNRLAASMNRTATVTVTTVQRTIFESGAGPDGKRALGGPVLSGKTYLVGERGPELLTMGAYSGNIIPNSQIGNVPNMANRNYGGGGVTNISINVNAGMGTDGAEVGRQVVEAIRKYERRSGQVFVSA
jgi:predicted secreted protein